jgi:MFS family permease
MQNADSPTPSIPADAAVEQRSNRSAMMIVFLVVFIDLLGFGIILPLLPRIAESYIKLVFPDPAWLVGLVIGLLMSSFSLMQFIFAPLWGQLSDRIGRRPILLVGLFASVVFYGLFGYAVSLPHHTGQLAMEAMCLMFCARIGAGIAGATIATAQAVIADSTPPEKRKHGMALIGAAFGIGFTFGPLIGFGCLKIGRDYPDIGLGIIGYTAAGLSLLALLLGIWLLPETRKFDTASTIRRHWLDGSAIGHALTNAAIGPVILTFFIASLGFGAFEVTLALFLKDNFNYGEDDSFLIFAYIGFVLMLTQGVLYRRLASRVSEVTFMALGIAFMAVGVALMGGISFFVWNLEITAPEGWMTPALFVALTCAVVGFAFLTPSAQALISRRTSSDRQGEILGVNQSASAMARIIGPVFGVTLYKMTDSHLLPYVAGAVLLIAMLPMLPIMRRGA